MKKFLILGLFVWAFLLSGCGFSSVRVQSLEFKVIDEMSANGAKEVVLEAVPDYGKREVRLTFNSNGEISEGLVGGDYFDRFEGLIRAVDGGKLDDYKGLSEDGSFFVTIVDDDGVVSQFVSSENDVDGVMEVFRSFYFDLVNLLTEEIPV